MLGKEMFFKPWFDLDEIATLTQSTDLCAYFEKHRAGEWRETKCMSQASSVIEAKENNTTCLSREHIYSSEAEIKWHEWGESLGISSTTTASKFSPCYLQRFSVVSVSHFCLFLWLTCWVLCFFRGVIEVSLLQGVVSGSPAYMLRVTKRLHAVHTRCGSTSYLVQKAVGCDLVLEPGNRVKSLFILHAALPVISSQVTEL